MLFFKYIDESYAWIENFNSSLFLQILTTKSFLWNASTTQKKQYKTKTNAIEVSNRLSVLFSVFEITSL